VHGKATIGSGKRIKSLTNLAGIKICNFAISVEIVHRF